LWPGFYFPGDIGETEFRTTTAIADLTKSGGVDVIRKTEPEFTPVQCDGRDKCILQPVMKT
jgi:hypothetical protein